MREQNTENTAPSDLSPQGLRSRALAAYRRSLDAIVLMLILVMLLTLLGAVAGLGVDFFTAANALLSGVQEHKLGTVDTLDRELVIDVLSVFVLVELFRTFADYIEFHRVRLMVLAEVGIAFVLREVFIGLYERSMNWPDILALSVLLAVLVSARIATVRFQPSGDAAD